MRRNNSCNSRRISDTFDHKDFITWHVTLIQIDNRSKDANKEEPDAVLLNAYSARVSTNRLYSRYLQRYTALLQF